MEILRQLTKPYCLLWSAVVNGPKKRVFSLQLQPMTRRLREDDELESTNAQKSLRLTGEGKSVVSL